MVVEIFRVMHTYAPSEKSRGSTVTSLTHRQETFFRPVKVQPKLITGAENDAYEREADAVAEQVTRKPTDNQYARTSGMPVHEITQDLLQPIRPYRTKPSKDRTKDKSKSFNFGVSDTSTLKEDAFNIKKDKETKPWIESISIELQFQMSDVNGFNTWVGDAKIKYYNNKVKFPDFKFSITAGSEEVGMTTAGDYTVKRIEGKGYNSSKYSGSYERAAKKGWGRRYAKDLNGNMNFAVFFTSSEALHSGPIDQSSHGCVHVDWSDETNMQQINYHSVIGLTKVKVTYP